MYFVEEIHNTVVQISEVVGDGDHEARTADVAPRTSQMPVPRQVLQRGDGERRGRLPHLRFWCYHWIRRFIPGTPSEFQVRGIESFPKFYVQDWSSSALSKLCGASLKFIPSVRPSVHNKIIRQLMNPPRKLILGAFTNIFFFLIGQRSGHFICVSATISSVTC